MAKLQLTTSFAGPNFSKKVGDIIEVSDAEAASHVKAGNGVIVAEDKKPAEAATSKK